MHLEIVLKQVKYLELFSALLIAPLCSWRETPELRFRCLPTAVLGTFGPLTNARSGIDTREKVRAFPGLFPRFHWYPSLVNSSKQISNVWTSSFLIWRILVLVKAYAFDIFFRPPSGLRAIFFSVLKLALFRTTQVVILTRAPQES